MEAEGGPSFESLLRRDRLITAIGLGVLFLLAWAYLLSGAGTGMSAAEMTRLAFFPHAASTVPPMFASPPPADPRIWVLSTGMWWTMMIAMMAPAAAPAILLYARVHRHAVAEGQAERLAPTGAFAAGYLTIWLGFSVVAAGVQWELERVGLLSSMTMESASRWLSSAVLVSVGLYQLSPLQHTCLQHCRAPASFLARNWRPGVTGALRLGARHGVYCLGCCWLLMALLFVGGVMNLVWIAAIALLVLAQKLAPGGVWIARATGAALIVWGVATLFV